MTKRWGPVAVGNEIQMIRSIFKHGFEAGIIDRPVRFGPGFKKPSAKVLRQTRAAAGPKLFAVNEIKSLLKHADSIMRPMVLLGLNAALGNTDWRSFP